MSTFVERMEKEYRELCSKLDKLDKFIESEDGMKMDDGEFMLMKRQDHAMRAYRNTLRDRLRYYKPHLPEVEE